MVYGCAQPSAGYKTAGGRGKKKARRHELLSHLQTPKATCPQPSTAPLSNPLHQINDENQPPSNLPDQNYTSFPAAHLVFSPRTPFANIPTNTTPPNPETEIPSPEVVTPSITATHIPTPPVPVGLSDAAESTTSARVQLRQAQVQAELTPAHEEGEFVLMEVEHLRASVHRWSCEQPTCRGEEYLQSPTRVFIHFTTNGLEWLPQQP